MIIIEFSSFFNSIDHDRVYKAEDWARYFSSFIANGVFPNPSNGLQVVAGTGMGVILKKGKAWINGYFYWIDEDLVIDLPNAHGSLNTIHRIVLRWSLTDRNIRAYYKSSNPSAQPTPPIWQRDEDCYELCLGDIYVTKGVTGILQRNITDRRLDKTLCGLVHGVVDQLDTTALGLQLQGFIDEFIVKTNLDYTGWQLELQDFEARILSLFNEFKGDQEEKLVSMQDAYNFYISQLELHLDGFDGTWQEWMALKEEELNQYPAGEWMAKVESLLKQQPTELIATVSNENYTYPQVALWGIENGIKNTLEQWGFSDGILTTIPFKAKVSVDNGLQLFSIPMYKADDWQVTPYQDDFWLLSSLAIDKALLLEMKG